MEQRGLVFQFVAGHLLVQVAQQCLRGRHADVGDEQAGFEFLEEFGIDLSAEEAAQKTAPKARPQLAEEAAHATASRRRHGGSGGGRGVCWSFLAETEHARMVAHPA